MAAESLKPPKNLQMFQENLEPSVWLSPPVLGLSDLSLLAPG